MSRLTDDTRTRMSLVIDAVIFARCYYYVRVTLSDNLYEEAERNNAVFY